MISRVKIISGLDIAEKRLPQDGRFGLIMNGRPVDFRVSVLPEVFGKKAAIRILERPSILKLIFTLWFTAFLILLCALVFVFIAVVSNQAATQDVNNALTGLVDRNMQEIGKKNISLTEDVQLGVKRKSDTALFVRMLVNLIRNAYRYGKEDGSIHVSLKENIDGIILSVADDGIGIAQDELPNIWNRFYRVDKSRSSSKCSGLGLGLAMLKQIAKLHKGNVHAESKLGKGSTFIIRFAKSE